MNNYQHPQYATPDIQPGITVSENVVVIILPALGTKPTGYTELAEKFTDMLRSNVSGLLHDAVMLSLLKAEVKAFPSRAEKTIGEMIATLEG